MNSETLLKSKYAASYYLPLKETKSTFINYNLHGYFSQAVKNYKYDKKRDAYACVRCFSTNFYLCSIGESFL